MFTNVEEDAVISAVDVDHIYKIPRLYFEQNLDRIVVRALDLETPPADLTEWDKVVESFENPLNEVTIALVGKYVSLVESYKSLSEALIHAGIHTRTRVNIKYIDSENLENGDLSELHGADAVLVPGGFGERGTEGMIQAVEYARINLIPYLGICLGMQVAVIEHARNFADMPRAHSTEFDTDTPYPVVALITEWLDESGNLIERSESTEIGGSMRLGSQKVLLNKDSRIAKIYGSTTIGERHRHRWEVNNVLRPRLISTGITIAGVSTDDLVEVVERDDHPWFIGCQFHPEFTSTPRDGHVLFSSFVKAAVTYHSGKE